MVGIHYCLSGTPHGAAGSLAQARRLRGVDRDAVVLASTDRVHSHPFVRRGAATGAVSSKGIFMNPPSADLRQLSRALTANNLRVMNFLDGLISRVDDVVEASFEHDWEQVGRVSQMIARYSELRGFPGIAESAAAVCEEAGNGCDEAEMRRRLLRLIGACGKARKQQRNEPGTPAAAN